jgi:antitoxin component YwqK of YwqJK toxin-antitoxin module
MITPWERINEDGTRSAGALENGAPHGAFREWHSNGQLRIERMFEHGVPHGIHRQFARDGRLLFESEMIYGVGTYIECYESGEPKYVSDQFRCDGLICGIDECYYINRKRFFREYSWAGRKVLMRVYLEKIKAVQGKLVRIPMPKEVQSHALQLITSKTVPNQSKDPTP